MFEKKYFKEILIKIHTVSLKKIHLKMLSGKCWPFCLSLNLLNGVPDAKKNDINIGGPFN